MTFTFLLTALLFTAFPPALGSDGPPVPVVGDTGTQFRPVQYLPDVPDRALPPKRVDASFGPVLHADAAIVIDAASGVPLYQKEPDAVVPIASLTKLMTAMVVLESGLDLSTSVTMIPEDDAIGGRLRVDAGEIVTAEDLLFAGLVGSANNAMQALARATGMPLNEFIAAMNERATAFGMHETTFTDVTGLSPGNVSTAREYVLLLREAFTYEVIREATTRRAHDLQTVEQKNFHHIRATNQLLDGPLTILGGKTGYTDEAGNCLALLVTDASGHEVYVVVLGSDTSAQRFRDAQSLALWSQQAFTWQ